MQDTEENRWLLLDMARAMGGYGYGEMWWPTCTSQTTWSTPRPTCIRRSPIRAITIRTPIGCDVRSTRDGFESVTEESLLADAWHMRDDIIELAQRGDVRKSLPDIDFDARLARLETGA